MDSIEINTVISDLFYQVYKHWYTDSDIVDEDNDDITKECIEIMEKYKQTDTIAIHITIALVDRNYIQSKEDASECLWFVKWFLLSKL